MSDDPGGPSSKYDSLQVMTQERLQGEILGFAGLPSVRLIDAMLASEEMTRDTGTRGARRRDPQRKKRSFGNPLLSI